MQEISENHVAMEQAAGFVQSTKHAALPLMEPNDQAVVAGIENAMSIAERYAAQVLGAERSARCGSRQGYRSGTRSRSLTTPLGELRVQVVKTRGGVLTPPFLQRAGKFTQDVVALGRRLWVQGLSLRSVAAVAPEATPRWGRGFTRHTMK